MLMKRKGIIGNAGLDETSNGIQEPEMQHSGASPTGRE
jgi:hypothetical protein